MSLTETIFDNLVWQVEAGADEAVGEVAGLIHWKAAPSTKAIQTAAPYRRADGGLPRSFTEAQAEAAPSPAAAPLPVSHAKSAGPMSPPAPIHIMASTLAELRAELDRFDGCELKAMAMNTVFADGNPEADIMILGDAPAEDEDRQGLPFAGANGKLLDKMLAAIGLDRDKVYLSSLIFWRPPGNRTPSELEIAACLPFTLQHIALKKPKILVLCGALTAKHILRTKEPFSKLRGRWAEFTPPLAEKDQSAVRCLPLYHPAYLLRQPEAKRLAWGDLLKLKQELTNS